MQKYKYILSAFVVVAFLLTGLYENHEAAEHSLTQINLPQITPAVDQTTPSSAVAVAPTIHPAGTYKDGVYTGPTTDAFYGLVQVRATIQNGKLSNVEFLSYPNDRSTSREINAQAMPILISEAISAQSAKVDIVTGATDTSQAYIQSLEGALSQAKS